LLQKKFSYHIAPFDRSVVYKTSITMMNPSTNVATFVTIIVTLMSIVSIVTAFKTVQHPQRFRTTTKPSSIVRMVSYLTDTTVTSPTFPTYTSPSTTTTTTVANPPMVAQRWRKSTKQVATLGPASNTMQMIETLFLAGADVFRLNFSHGATHEKQELVHIIRSIEEKYSHPIAILGDLQGPKLRVRMMFCVTLCLLQLLNTNSSFPFRSD
jgi:Pyruvate kinase, barrel domain